MPERVTRGALVAHRHSFAPPRCRTSQDRRTFVPLSVSLWNALIVTLCWTGGLQEQSQCFPVGMICSFFFCLLLFYIFLPSMGWLCGVGVFGLIECSHSLSALRSGLQFNNNLIIIIIMQVILEIQNMLIVAIVFTW